AYVGFTYASPVLTWGGAIAGLIIVIIAVFNRKRSALWAPLYAGFEGLFVGGVSAMYATLGGGIILQAVSLTLLVFFVMLVIYKSGIIPVTNKFRTGVIMATGAIFLLYVISMVMSMFGVHMPMIHEGGTFGILFSIGVIGIAALNLLLDFDLFEKAEEYQAPDYMEWFAGMSLLITIVWIYIEVLRLLSKMRN
ncbi:MAG: Bax inhibitor-1/YccA family protein, partial [Saprospiraceae bacterium]|nr:Bax inhibitor-1/YccA family protein [Saprospiraceae bacterium]